MGTFRERFAVALCTVLVFLGGPLLPAGAAPDPCFESTDPECGPVVWEPAPQPNDPPTITFTVDPSRPQAGDTVSVHITIDDPDSATADLESVDWGDGSPVEGVVCDPFPQYGTWPPPPERAVHAEFSEAHRYADAGDYTAVFGFDLGCGAGPYREHARIRIPITVERPVIVAAEVCVQRRCAEVAVPRP